MIRLRAAFLLLLLAGLAPAQDEPPATRKKVLREGTHVLRRILHDHGFTSLQGMDDLGHAPKRTLLVALGNLEILDEIPGGLEKFVREGGAVLLASDRPVKGRSARQALIDTAGVSINAEKVSCFDAQSCYRTLQFCPIIQPVLNPPVQLFASEGNPMGGPLVVATNVPSFLRVRRLGLTRRTAQLPAACMLETGQGWQAPPEPQPAFAVAGEVGEGRVLALADHSVFINEMMLPLDTNNVEFTTNCLRWLREAGLAQTRDLVLVMEEGRPQTRLDLPLKSARMPVEEMLRALLWERRNTLLVEAERKLAALENQGPLGPRFVGLLAQHGWPWGRIVSGALVVLTLAGLLYFAWRVGAVERFGHDRVAEPLLHAVDDRLPDRPLAQQRLEAMLAGDAREPLRALARALLAGAVEPPRPLSGGWLARWRLGARLRRAWTLANGWPSPIPARRVAWWQHELDDLRARRDNGEWGTADGQLAA